MEILRKLAHNKPSEWNTYLQSAIFAYNVSYHLITKFSPFQMVYSRHPALLPILYLEIKEPGDMTPKQYMECLADNLIKIQTQALSNTINLRTRAYNNLNQK